MINFRDCKKVPEFAQKLEELKALAKEASKSAYCPYSRFAVGAAVLTGSGKIIVGCNVENASYGLTICAERNAIFRAVAERETSIIAVVIYTPTPSPSSPCGACRQVIWEFGQNAMVHCFCDGPQSISAKSAEL